MNVFETKTQKISREREKKQKIMKTKVNGKQAALCFGMMLSLVLTAILLGCGDDSKSTTTHTPKFLVALDDTASADNVNVFTVNPSTGDLTPVTGSPFTTGLSDGAAAVVHPKHGNWIFAADWTGNVQTLVLGSDGTPTASSAPSGYSSFGWVNGLAVSADGKYLYTSTDGTDIVVWSIDQSTGGLTKAGTYTTPLTETYGVAVSAGFIYASDTNSSNRQVHVASIGTTGALTSVQTVTVPVPMGINGYELWTVAVDKTGKFLFVGDENATITTYSIGSDGKLTFVGQAVQNGGDGDMDSISISADNKFLYTTTDRTGSAVFSIDQSTGNLTLVTGSPFGTEDSYGSVVVDPSSKFVYISNACSDIVAYQRKATDGTLSPLDASSSPTTYATKYGASCGFAVSW